MTAKECTLAGCSRPLTARGWCHFHYYRWKRWGDPLAEGKTCICENCDGIWLRTAKGGRPDQLCPTCRETNGKCSLCGEIKSRSDFYSLKNDRISSRCKPCSTEYAKMRHRLPDSAARGRKGRLKWLYGMTPEQWQEMFDAQDGRCKICGDAVTLVVDHCHREGHVRSLLCSPCNVGLGAFRDDPFRLAAAIEYLHMSSVGVT